MTNSANTPKPPRHPPFDERFEREESSVRSRGSGELPKVRRERELVLPPAPSPAAEVATSETGVTRETMAERAERLNRKIAAAHLVLRSLPPTDARARLLASAILRRDEVLLDAVLSGLGDAWRDIIEVPEPQAVRQTRKPK